MTDRQQLETHLLIWLSLVETEVQKAVTAISQSWSASDVANAITDFRTAWDRMIEAAQHATVDIGRLDLIAEFIGLERAVDSPKISPWVHRKNFEVFAPAARTYFRQISFQLPEMFQILHAMEKESA